MKLVNYFLMLGISFMAFNSYGQNDDELSRFFSEVKTFQADFTQSVKDESGEILEQSNGQFSLSRPGKFSWIYAEPLPQKIISNSDNVWLYDEDLEQVTIRDYQTALNGSPAELLAGSMSIVDFYDVIRSEPQANVVQYQLIPKDDDRSFTQITIVFNQGDLASLSLTDSFARLTALEFTNRVINPLLQPSLFEFMIPDGVDVIQSEN